MCRNKHHCCQEKNRHRSVFFRASEKHRKLSSSPFTEESAVPESDLFLHQFLSEITCHRFFHWTTSSRTRHLRALYGVNGDESPFFIFHRRKPYLRLKIFLLTMNGPLLVLFTIFMLAWTQFTEIIFRDGLEHQRTWLCNLGSLLIELLRTWLETLTAYFRPFYLLGLAVQDDFQSQILLFYWYKLKLCGEFTFPSLSETSLKLCGNFLQA